jgi:hypothetical protein
VYLSEVIKIRGKKGQKIYKLIIKEKHHNKKVVKRKLCTQKKTLPA